MKQIMFALMLVLMLGVVASAEFDNTLTYSNNDMKVELKNWFGLQDYGSAELKSHTSIDEEKQVHAGYDYPLYYDFAFTKEYKDGLGNVTFKDMNTGEFVEREYEYVYWGVTEGNLYGNEICNNYKDKNGVMIYDCQKEVIGYGSYNDWLPYNTKDIPLGNVRIGIKVYVLLDDYIDAVWTIGGKKLNKHAVYITDGHGIDQSSSASDDYFWRGFNISTNEKVNLISVGRASGHTGDTVFLWNNTNPATSIANASYVGGIANFTGIVLEINTNYILVSGKIDKSTPTHKYSTAGGFPFAGTNINFVKSAVVDASWTVGSPGVNNIFNIANVTTQEWTAPDSNPQFKDWTFVNDSNYTISTVNVNSTWFDNNILDNVSVYLDGVVNQTNSSHINNSLYNFAIVIPDGTHLLKMDGWDNASNVNTTSERYVNVDTTNPKIKIHNPNSTVQIDGYVTTPSVTTPLNYTATDSNLASCWYSIDGGTTNTTVGACTNISSIVVDYGTYTFDVWVNDTFGRTNHTSVTKEFAYKIIEELHTYTSHVLEGSTQTFKLNITIGSGYDYSSSYIYYNNTAYYLTADNWVTNNYSLTKSLIIPFVTNTLNKTFLYSITLNDSSNLNSSSFQQQITNITVDNCGTNTNEIYNFTIKDEQTQVAIPNDASYNTSGDVNIQIKSYAGTSTVAEYNHGFDAINPFRICINDPLTTSKYNVDAQVQYYEKDEDYVKEFYHIQNGTLQSSVINVTDIMLYDLNNVSSTEFKITYKDANFLPVKNALVIIQRKYIDEGAFKTVEIPITDTEGETIAHLEVEDILYTFIIQKNGVILATFSNVLVDCDTILTECEINLNSFSSHLETKDYTILDDFTYTLTYDESTRLLQSLYTIPSGTPSTVLLNATMLDGLGSTQACYHSLSTASGTLQCTVPQNLGNGSVYVVLTKDAVIQARGTIKLEQKPEDIYGASIFFLLLFFYSTLIGIGISDNPMMMGLFLLLAVGLAVLLNIVDGTGFIGVGSTVLWFIIAVIVVLIKGSNRT